MRHDVYTEVTFRKVTVTVQGIAMQCRGWVYGDFVAVAAGPGWGWKVHRFSEAGASNASTELVKGLDRDAAIAIVHDAAKSAYTRLKDFQKILRVHLGGFAL